MCIRDRANTDKNFLTVAFSSVFKLAAFKPAMLLNGNGILYKIESSQKYNLINTSPFRWRTVYHQMFAIHNIFEKDITFGKKSWNTKTGSSLAFNTYKPLQSRDL